jgi:GNAT superfamily N-acetyltransferase
MTDIEIRRTRPGDGAACAEMWREAGGFFAGINPHTFQVPAAEGLAEWFEEINATLRGHKTMVHLVAEVDGVLAGNVSASLVEPLDTAERQLQTDLSRRRLHVDSLGVTEAHRRGGVGTALLQAVEEWGRSRGAEVVVLETESNNPMSVPFYEQRMGFSAQAVVFRKVLQAPRGGGEP